jgi:16S rRNA (guanine966-N2)-methyltransferase
MRIVGGQFKGRVLLAPAGQAIRPTADRARQALFNIVAHGESELAGAAVLDAFAGTGALGLEALSRGAAHATFMDIDKAALAAIQANARKLAVLGQCAILRADVLSPPAATRPCRFVLLDPPYRSGLAAPALTALRAKGWLADDAALVIEVAAGEPFASPLKDWRIADERKYGAARLVFLSRQ